jgi:hypothetical protein
LFDSRPPCLTDPSSSLPLRPLQGEEVTSFALSAHRAKALSAWRVLERVLVGEDLARLRIALKVMYSEGDENRARSEVSELESALRKEWVSVSDQGAGTLAWFSAVCFLTYPFPP